LHYSIFNDRFQSHLKKTSKTLKEIVRCLPAPCQDNFRDNSSDSYNYSNYLLPAGVYVVLFLVGSLVGSMKFILSHPKKKRLWVVLSLMSFFLLMAPVVSAQQSSSSIAQGFQADTSVGEIVAGALVSIKVGTLRNIELATQNTADQMVGIVDKNPFVAISRENQETQVVLSGTTTVLVSDINGEVESGDKVTISPIAGVGMKATADSQVVGTAQSDFKATSTKKIDDKDGKAHDVRIGHVEIQVGIAYYQAPGSNYLPPFIQNAANSLAGRPVSLVRILICSILLLLGFTTVIILVYTSVRSAMTSIGRNPLAAKAIRKGLYQVGAVSLIVVGGTLLASYLVLSL